MNREVALKIVLAWVGLLFLALAYPLMMFVRQDPALSIMFSIYFARCFLASRNPQPIGESQPDRFYSMVELCSCRRFPTTI
jgi:hypothetical protein